MADLAVLFGCTDAHLRRSRAMARHDAAGAPVRSWLWVCRPCEANRSRTVFESRPATRRQARLRAFLSSLVLSLYLLLSLVVTALRSRYGRYACCFCNAACVQRRLGRLNLSCIGGHSSYAAQNRHRFYPTSHECEARPALLPRAPA